MKPDNFRTDHSAAAALGRVSTRRAGSPGLTLRTATTEANGVEDVTLIGLTLIDNGDGTALVLAGGGSGSGEGGGDTSGVYTQDEADDLFLTRRGGEGPEPVTLSASGAAATLDLSAGNWFDVTLTANCTLTFSNPPPLAGEWTILLRQDGTGSRTVTWPGAVDWQDTDGTGGGAAPTLFTAAGAVDVIVITTLDGGTSYGGGQDWKNPETIGHYEVLMDGAGNPLDNGSGLDWLWVWVS